MTTPPPPPPRPHSPLGVLLRGMAMGAADVVPGVSGGTVAFISGIYDRLLAAVGGVPEALATLPRHGVLAAWRRLDGTFLLLLVSGILLSIFSLARGITWALHHHPVPVWGFFFGLIVASVLYVGRQVGRWGLPEFAMLLLGTGLVYGLSVLPPLSPSASLPFLFLAGALASCAMILPGISGSFILLLIGAYAPVLAAVAGRDLLTVAVVGAGAVLGLLLFSRLLRLLLTRFHGPLLALLTGFLVGSLWKIWPWKADSLVYLRGTGPVEFASVTDRYTSLAAYLQSLPMSAAEGLKAYVQTNVWPGAYAAQNGVPSEALPALGLALLGAALVLGLERLGRR